jgi:hypothetical protein
MATTPHSVVLPAPFELCVADGSTIPVTCRLSYDSADAFAVTAQFTLGQQQTTWVFGRDLLQAGLQAPSGEGDVQIRPGFDDEGRPAVYLELLSPEGRALLRASAARITTFLRATQILVPVGGESERIDVDELLRELLRVS